MARMSTTTDERKSPTKKILVLISAVALVTILVLAVVGSRYLLNTPKISSPYVEVDYKTVGWFWQERGESDILPGFNETYLVLDVTISNHGYSQVNVTRPFEVTINNETCFEVGSPASAIFPWRLWPHGNISSPSLCNGSSKFVWVADPMWIPTYNMTDTLSQAMLSSNERINAAIMFEMGNVICK